MEKEINGKKAQFCRSTYNKKDLDKLNPNNINNRLFWKELNKNFKFAPVFGFKCENIEMGNNGNIGIFGKLVYKYAELFSRRNILEIGYGFGSFPTALIKHNFEVKSYVGIDLVNRIGKNTFPSNYKFSETNGWIIPEQIKNLDVIFSSNVFQHITFKQKINYLKIGYDRLKPGSHFIFNCIFRSEELMKNKPELWGKVDEFGIPYLQMFDQFVVVDDVEDIINEAKNIGYEVIECDNHVDHIFNVVLKK